jgi:transcriptional regulator of acetoin/glycerol metabolism
VKRALALAEGRKIRVEDLPGGVRESLETGPRVTAPRRWRTAPSRIELERLLREHRGNISGVAKALDRQWAVVHRWLRQHDLNADQYRG